MPYQTPETKLEQVAEVYLATGSPPELEGVPIFRRFALTTKTFPHIVVKCMDLADGEPDAIYQTGNWIAELEIIVRSKIGKTTPEAHDLACGVVRDMLMRDDALPLLNEIGKDYGLRVLRVRVNRIEGSADNERNTHDTSHMLEAYIVPSAAGES